MQLRGLTFVLLRLLSIFFFSTALDRVFMFMPIVFPNVRELYSNVNYVQMIPGILYTLVIFVGSAFLWVKADIVAGWVTGGRRIYTESVMKLRGWSRLIVTITGLLIALWALPNVLQQTGRLFLYYDDDVTYTISYQERVDTWMLWAAAVVQLLVGAMLFFRAEGLYGMVLKFRDAGLQKAKEE